MKQGRPIWHMFQNALEVPLEVAVDTDILNPRTGGLIGAFDKNGLIGAIDDSAIRSTLRFVKAGSGAMLFESPGAGPIDKVGQNRMVALLKADPKWSKVETTFHYGNSGSTRQGYMETALLGSIDKMT